LHGPSITTNSSNSYFRQSSRTSLLPKARRSSIACLFFSRNPSSSLPEGAQSGINPLDAPTGIARLRLIPWEDSSSDVWSGCQPNTASNTALARGATVRLSFSGVLEYLHGELFLTSRNHRVFDGFFPQSWHPQMVWKCPLAYSLLIRINVLRVSFSSCVNSHKYSTSSSYQLYSSYFSPPLLLSNYTMSWQLHHSFPRFIRVLAHIKKTT
jgi:hypothetical protein